MLLFPRMSKAVFKFRLRWESWISILPEQVPGVYLVFYIIQYFIVPVGDNAAALFLEFLQVIDNPGAEEGGAVGEGWFVDDDSGALGLDALHDSLNGGVPEIVGV